MPEPASSFMTGNAPAAASYAAPLLNFAPLSKLPEDLYGGQQRARTTRLQNAFPDGLPRNQDGTVDVNTVGDTLTKLGGAEYASQMMPFLIQSQMGSQGAAAIDQATGQPGAPVAAPMQSPTTVPGASGPANIRGPQRQPAGPNGMPAQPALSSAGTDNNGQDSIRSVATEQFGGRDVSPLIPRFAAALGVSPDAPLSPQQVTQARAIMARSAQAGNSTSTATGAGAPVTPLSGAAGGAAPPSGPAQDNATPSVSAMPGQNAGGGGIPNAAAGLVPQGYDPNGFANALTQRAAALRSQAARYAAFPAGASQAKVLQEQAQAMDDRAKQIFEVIGKGAEPTPEMKNYQAGRQPGESLTDYQARVAGATKQAQVTAENTAMTPEQKNLMPTSTAPQGAAVKGEELKAQVAMSQKVYSGMQAAATQFERDLKPYNDLAKSIVNDPRFFSGFGSNAVLDFNRVRTALGDPQAAVLQEAFEKVKAAGVLGLINTQKDQMQEAGANSSRIFAQQVALVEKASPGLVNTPAGNRFLIEVQSRMGDLSSHVVQMARDYIAQRGHLDPQFDGQLAAYMKANPIFSKQEMSHPELLAAPSAPPAATNKQQIVAWGRSMGLKPGDAMRMPDGSIKAMP